MAERWVKMVKKAAMSRVSETDLNMRVQYLYVPQVVKLLSHQHRAVETKIKSVRSVYVKAQAESERVRERSTGKARREAQLDVTHLQVGIDVCDELLAALAKQGKGGR